jgi:hypothetical protein
MNSFPLYMQKLKACLSTPREIKPTKLPLIGGALEDEDEEVSVVVVTATAMAVLPATNANRKGILLATA